MPESLLQTLFDFRWLLFISLPLGLLLLFLGLALGDNLGWRQRRMKIFGIFYGLNWRQTLWLASGLLRLLFVLALVVFTLRVTELGFTAFYVGLFLLCALLFFSPKRALLELVNSAVIYVALTVASVLNGYFRDVNGDARTLVVYVLLALFIVEYVAYQYARGVSELLQYKISQVDPNASSRLLQLELDDFASEQPKHLDSAPAEDSNASFFGNEYFETGLESPSGLKGVNNER